jgi:hypothetical protein
MRAGIFAGLPWDFGSRANRSDQENFFKKYAGFVTFAVG